MSGTLTDRMEMTIAETITVGTPAATDAKSLVTHDGFNVASDLTSTTGVPVTKAATFTIALSGGAISIDLTALPGTNLGTVDMSTLKVQFVLFQNPLGNAAMTIADGASNGYGGWGASFLVVLQPGCSCMLQGLDLEPDVGASAKVWDITGTGTESLNVSVVCG